MNTNFACKKFIYFKLLMHSITHFFAKDESLSHWPMQTEKMLSQQYLMELNGSGFVWFTTVAYI